MFGLSTSQRFENWEVRVEENYNGLCRELWVYDNLSLSRTVARVFSLKSTYLNMWVMWVYIVCVETWCIRCDKLAKRLFREYLTGRPYPRDTRKNQMSPSCPDSSLSSHVHGTCITLRDAYSWATRENTSIFNALSLHTHSLSHIQPLQINPTWNTGYKRLNIITIKFGTE